MPTINQLGTKPSDVYKGLMDMAYCTREVITHWDRSENEDETQYQVYQHVFSVVLSNMEP